MVFAKLSVDNRIYEQGHQYDVDEKIGFHAKKLGNLPCSS